MPGGFRGMQLKEMSKMAFENFRMTFLGAAGLKGCKQCVRMARDEEHGYADDSAYDKANDMLHSMLLMATAENRQAQQILAKYMESGPTGLGDGHAGYKELQETCMGGGGVETAAGRLQQMFSMDAQVYGTEVLRLTTDHMDIHMALKGLPDMTADQIHKQHLLWLLRRLDDKMMYQYVDEVCSDEKVTYAETHGKIVARYHKLNAGSDEMLGELAGQAAMAKKNDFACWKCGSKEHKKIDCPMWKRNKERELGNPRHLKEGEEETLDQEARLAYLW